LISKETNTKLGGKDVNSFQITTETIGESPKNKQKKIWEERTKEVIEVNKIYE